MDAFLTYEKRNAYHMDCSMGLLDSNEFQQLSQEEIAFLVKENEIFKYIPDSLKNEALCTLAVKKDPDNIKYVPESSQTFNVLKIALSNPLKGSEKLFTAEIDRQLDRLHPSQTVSRLSKRQRGNKKTESSPEYYSSPVHYESHIQICCNEADRDHIVEMVRRIKRIPEYHSLSYTDIIKVLIFSYYALRYDEHIVPVYISLEFLEKKLENLKLGTQLLFDLTINDVMDHGVNLSSEFRKHLFQDQRIKATDDPNSGALPPIPEISVLPHARTKVAHAMKKMIQAMKIKQNPHFM